MRPLRSLFRRVFVTQWLLVQARACLALRRYEAASAVLRRLLQVAPGSFRVHLLLAKASLAKGEHGEALQELAICNRLDRERFVRESLPAGIRNEVESRFRGRCSVEGLDTVLSDAVPHPGEWDDLLDSQDGPLEPAPPGTDFLDAGEWRRFQALPPIHRADLLEVDLEVLLARLVEDCHPGETRDQA